MILEVFSRLGYSLGSVTNVIQHKDAAFHVLKQFLECALLELSYELVFLKLVIVATSLF